MEATTMKRIKRITSHVGLSRYLETVEETGQVIKCVTSIPSPYSSGPDHVVYQDTEGRGLVFIVETAHKQYDIFSAFGEELFPWDWNLQEGTLTEVV
jgi:hypothetical protein